MTPSNDLHQLIKSLSINEKRYFKIFAERHVIKGENNYVKLFDFIESQKEYDEVAVKQAFKKEVFIRHLPSEKNYLYNLILRCLEGYYSTADLENELRSKLLHVKILFEKRLFEPCRKIIKKSIAVALKHELYAIATDFARWDLRLLRNDSFRLTEVSLSEKQNLLLTFIEKNKNYHQFAFLQAHLSLIHNQQSEPRSLEEIKPFERVMSNILLKDEAKAITFNSKIFYFLSHSLFNHFKCEYKTCIFYAQKIIDLIDSNPHLKNAQILTYHTCLYNIGSSCLALGNYPKSEEVVKKLNFEKDIDYTLRTKKVLFYHILNLELLHNNAIKKYEKNKKIILEAEPALFKENPADNRLHFTCVNIATTHFWKKDYKESKRYLNMIINNEYVDKGRENYFLSLLILFIINIELKDEGLIESSARSLTRYLHKRGKLFKLEKSLLDFVNKNIYKLSENNISAGEWKHLKNELEVISQNPFEKKLFIRFNLLEWIKEKSLK